MTSLPPLEIGEGNGSRSAEENRLRSADENGSRSAIFLTLKKDEENRSRSAILLAQIALITATICFWKTRLYAEHDSTGFKTALSYQIIAILVSNSRILSDVNCFKFIHEKRDFKVNSIANFICFILAIVLEKFYEKSLSSLGFTLSITVLLLILLVIIRPSTDLGLFGFLIGVIGSITHDLFGLKFQTWIVVAICFPLLGFRFWLDKDWLGSQPDERCKKGGYDMPWIIEVLTVAGFHLFCVYNLFSTNCQALEGQPKSISCTSSSAMGAACVLIFNLYLGEALICLVSDEDDEDEDALSQQTDPGPRLVTPLSLPYPSPRPPKDQPTMRRRDRKPSTTSGAPGGIDARPPLSISSAQVGSDVYSLFQTEPESKPEFELEQEAIAPKKED